MSSKFSQVAVIGCGAMGRGIAQLATQAGSAVQLFDIRPDTARDACEAISLQWERMAVKGKIESEQSKRWQSMLRSAETLTELAGTDLVIEAVVESLDVKRSLFKAVSEIAGAKTVLASNTSSLSITAIAAGQECPERFAGLHFFNPAPLMRVAEVVAGLKTSAAVCDRLCAFVAQMGHTPVRAADTPGFIVNHAGRAFGTEALRIVGEQIADFATVDRILRDQAGFRLGPFELLDLTGLDVSHPVMESIYRQYYEEPRYRPSVITAQRLSAGMLGRKSGEGFYRYVDGKVSFTGQKPPQAGLMPGAVWVSPSAFRRDELQALVNNFGVQVETGHTPSAQALILVAPLGLDVSTVVGLENLDPCRTMGIDTLLGDSATKRRVLCTNPGTASSVRDSAFTLFATDEKPVDIIRDSAGFITQRVLAAIVNVASDICQQGICSPEDLDTAVTLGLGYPSGPLAIGDVIGAANVLEILVNQQTVYGDPRYRPSPWLKRRAALGLSLLKQEL